MFRRSIPLLKANRHSCMPTCHRHLAYCPRTTSKVTSVPNTTLDIVSLTFAQDWPWGSAILYLHRIVLCHNPEDHASRKKPLSWSNVKKGAVKASAAVTPALSGRKKLRILQDNKRSWRGGCPVLCINMESSLQHQHCTFSVYSLHMSAGDGTLPEATNPEEMSPALIAIYGSTHLEALLMPAVQEHAEHASELQTCNHHSLWHIE